MYKPTYRTLWQGRIDAADGSEGARWHQFVELINLDTQAIKPVIAPEHAFAILGFCSDEGVRRNQGRVGAFHGPDSLRQAMASYANHFQKGTHLYDAGNVYCTEGRLEEAETELSIRVAKLVEAGTFPILLGGGHEIAYGHYEGLYKGLKALRAQKSLGAPRIGIINLDAHFDLRSYEHAISSGTPFLQIADYCEDEDMPFRYMCLGIQRSGNTQKLFNTAKKHKVEWVPAEEVNMFNAEKLNEKIVKFAAKVDAIYVSLDLDVMAGAFAPGVSAVNALGIYPDIVMELIKRIIRTGKMVSMDVAELAPSYDVDNRTAKLAGSILYYTLAAIEEYIRKPA
jgi:formiminoglutamase